MSEKLKNRSFVITGPLSQPRTEIESRIEEEGGTVSSSVSKNTTHLVTNDPSDDSTKLKKARDLGFTVENGKIISEMELNKLMVNAHCDFLNQEY